MFEDDTDEILEDQCPRCMIGRIQVSSRPFLRLYRKRLFIIPDGLCYECDICGYYEFEETNYDIINQMLDGATLPHYDSKPIQTLLSLPPEDELPGQTKFPPA
jgi:hypothetical protein